jgi:hypothetical protein
MERKIRKNTLYFFKTIKQLKINAIGKASMENIRKQAKNRVNLI